MPITHFIDPHTRSALRRAVRFACTLDVEGVGAVAGVATDLSARGLWVAMQEPLEIGVLLTAEFRLPRTGRDLSVAAEVARVDANSWGFGMGLRFRSISPSDRVFLDAALRGLPPRLPLREDRFDTDAAIIVYPDPRNLGAQSGRYAIRVDDEPDDGFATPSDEELERFVR